MLESTDIQFKKLTVKVQELNVDKHLFCVKNGNFAMFFMYESMLSKKNMYENVIIR